MSVQSSLVVGLRRDGEVLKRRSPQGTFLDVEAAAGLRGKPIVPRDSIYHELSEADDIFDDALFAPAYAQVGRPAISPGMLTKVLLLQQMEGISDREAEARARYDLRWKQALRVPIDEAGFESSTLSVFRTRLLVNGLEAQVFQQILETAAARGLISQQAAVQVVDSTYTLGAGAVQDTYTLLCTVIRKLLRVLNRRMDFTARLAPGLRVDYGGKGKKPKIDWNDPEAKQRLLSELVADARQVLAATAGLELTAAETRLVELLGVVATQDVSEDEAGRVVLKQGVAKDRVISATDPELRHGRKSRARKFDGYKTHTAVDVESEFITSVATTPGNVHDSEAATQLVDAQPPEQRPQVLIGDSAYGTGQVRAELAGHQVQVVAPVPEGPPPAGRFPKTEFTIDLVAGTCRCPAGELAAEQRYSRKGRLKAFAFSAGQCGGCPHKDQCTQSKHQRRVVTVHAHEQHLQEGRAFAKTEAYAELYGRRHLVERKQAELVRHGVRQARYRGQRKVTLQVYLAAAMVNFKRLCTLARQLTAAQALPAPA